MRAGGGGSEGGGWLWAEKRRWEAEKGANKDGEEEMIV